jgi:hypothetical protein
MKDAAFLLHSIQMTGSLFILALVLGAVTAFFMKDAVVWVFSVISTKTKTSITEETLMPIKHEREESDLVKIAKKIADRKRAQV